MNDFERSQPLAAMNSFRSIFAAAAALLAMPVAWAAPVIEHAHAGNVTTTSVTIAWQTTEAAVGGLEVFADAAATVSLAGTVAIEAQSLEENRRETGATAAGRAEARTLVAAMGMKQVFLFRVVGLSPGTTYHFRPLARDAGGATMASGPLIEATTAATARLVPESRQLLVDLSALEAAGGPAAGALVTVATPGARWPLIAVVGDSFSPTLARVDLTAFLDPAGEANLLPPPGPLPLSISWLGLSPVAGSFDPDTVGFDGSPTAAASSLIGFIIEDDEVILAATQASSPAVVGLPVRIDLRANGSDGQPQAAFNRPLTIDPLAALGSGAGNTPSLAGGQLAGLPLIFQTAGSHTLTIRDPLGTAQTTLSINVLPMNYDHWRLYHFGAAATDVASAGRNADGDTLSNGAEYVLFKNPRVASGSAVDGGRRPGADLVLQYDYNHHQREYAVVIEVSHNLQDWHPSPVVPVVVSAAPDRNRMEAAWTAAELQAQTHAAEPQGGYFARVLMETATDYAWWVERHGLTGPAAAPTADADGDGKENYDEFALDSNPASGAASGKVRNQVMTLGGVQVLVLTIPMRETALPSAIDTPGGELIFDADGVRYLIQASLNAVGWKRDVVEVEVDTSSLPGLTPGWAYRSFRTPGGASPEFIRAVIEPLP